MRSTGPHVMTGIQSLRGLAAMMVVAYHAGLFWNLRVSGTDVSHVWWSGAAGVDIFFIISGFVIATADLHKGSGPQAALQFFKRRLLRVFPVYWIVTTIFLLRLRPWVHDPQAFPFSIAYLVKSYLLIPMAGASGRIAPLLSPGWTLTFELFFYTLFGLALLFRWNVVRSLTIALTLLSVFDFLPLKHLPALATYLDSHLLEFLAGVWLSVAYRSGRRIPTAWALGMGLCGLGAILTVPHPPKEITERLLWGVPALALVTATVMLEAKLKPLLSKAALLIGDASYSIYLTHWILLMGCFRLLTGPLGVVLKLGVVRVRDEVVCMGVCVVLLTGAGVVFYLLIERPITRYLGRTFGSRRTDIRAVSNTYASTGSIGRGGSPLSSVRSSAEGKAGGGV